MKISPQTRFDIIEKAIELDNIQNHSFTYSDRVMQATVEHLVRFFMNELDGTLDVFNEEKVNEIKKLLAEGEI